MLIKEGEMSMWDIIILIIVAIFLIDFLNPNGYFEKWESGIWARQSRRYEKKKRKNIEP